MLEKLVLNLKNKKTRKKLIKNLNQVLKHALKSKLHRVIRFEQFYWLKPYIMFNRRLKIATVNEYEKSIFKTIKKVKLYYN